jgi:hypothetical protein
MSWKFFGLGINGYGLEDYRENSTHTWFTKQRCVVSFSIKCLYTRLDLVEITIYHKAHTWIDESFAHDEHDSKSIFRMSHYVPCMSQTLKDHIWAQLRLNYTAKQIYDNRKTIWWECVNAGQSMTSDLKTLHIWIRNIRKGIDIYTLTLQFQFDLRLSNI